MAQGVSPGIGMASSPAIPLPRSNGGGGRGRGRARKPTADAVGHNLMPLPGLFVGGWRIHRALCDVCEPVATTNRRFDSSWAVGVWSLTY